MVVAISRPTAISQKSMPGGSSMPWKRPDHRTMATPMASHQAPMMRTKKNRLENTASPPEEHCGGA
jgi:hypothetical protein